ncbi:hypothetical protein HDU86_005711 [Geranomyces michiganensis]|nr:hypothetical protein HDU86_005711 [Geranomyces michiganensis]
MPTSASQETLTGGSGFLSDWADDQDKTDFFDPSRRKPRTSSMRSLTHRDSASKLSSSTELANSRRTSRGSFGAGSLEGPGARDILAPMRQQSGPNPRRGSSDARAVPPRSRRRIDLQEIYSSILGADWEAMLRPPPPKARKPPPPPVMDPHPLLRTLSRHNTNLDMFEIDRLMWEQQRARAEHRRRRPQARRRRSTSEGSAAAPVGWAQWVSSLLMLRQVATAATQSEDSESEDEQEEEDFVIEWERRRVVRAAEIETPALAQLRAVKAVAETLWDPPPETYNVTAVRPGKIIPTPDSNPSDFAHLASPQDQLIGPVQLAAVLRAAAPPPQIIGRPLTALSFTRGWSRQDGFPQLIAKIFPQWPDRPEEVESKEMNVL